ncbi:hypothetical protein OG455_27430 [Kitasatospora sp. NBC_01287]|uniref:hypothetical protein n=1 Tax=Kitasatospora sp. NBC_01287 TaxID=2903573 RepID=UPI0022509233|nr:hypothetical protein [Kitasatospora sp. NBC_01287]MCX4749192.1 hypothetical protein [Kitasatospora sp. NBC_01287]
MSPEVKAFVLSLVDQRVAAGLAPIRDSLKIFTAEVQAAVNTTKARPPLARRARLIARRSRQPPDTS